MSLLSLVSPAEKFYAAIILIGAAISGYEIWAFHERALGARNQLAELKTKSDKAISDANDEIRKLTAAHTAEVQTLKDQANAQHANDLAQHNSDAERLRQYDAYRRQGGSSLPSTSAGPATASGSESSTGRDGDSLSRLEQVALGLATAGRDLANTCGKVNAEAASNVGK